MTELFTSIETDAAEKEAMNGNDHISFCGMNCNDYLDENSTECEGWNGESRRCSCGNRRVAWSYYKDSSNKVCAIADAY